ncbi:metallophosphoesterase family protein [Jiangella alba]|uniref:metallophosphoesterase family protein n=2 Tax=Jiangella alba TaxID=561176 RepID=UPI00083E9732|nr:metallophosphoesterase [Jiangella alba]
MSMHRILHLSDTHVSATGADADGVDGLAALRGLLRDLHDVPDIDAVVVTGDIADDGSAAGCRAVREAVGDFARERGVPQIYTTGNHDDRAAFEEALGSGHLDAGGRDVGRLVAGPGVRCAVSEVGGLRIITLDSLVPGSAYGELGDEQLVGLRQLLSRPAPAGSVIALHHPPIDPPYSPLAMIGLRSPERLAAAIAGTDVRAVLCGHFHLQLSGSLGAVPVWVVPGVVTRIDLTAAPRFARAVTGAGAALVDLPPGSGLRCHTLMARDPGAGREVYLVDRF